MNNLPSHNLVASKRKVRTPSSPNTESNLTLVVARVLQGALESFGIFPLLVHGLFLKKGYVFCK